MRINKIISNLKELSKLRNSKKKIGLCHGVFDIFHYGHMLHLQKAKKNCDILVVSVTSDNFVNKGPNQPVNDSNKRLSILSSIEFVDYVYLSNNQTSEKILNTLKPNVYFKGKDYLKGDFTKNLQKEKKIVSKHGGKTFFTNTDLMSSTKIMNNNFDIWQKDQKNYLTKIAKEKVLKHFQIFTNKIKKTEVNIIGEVILDKYVYVSPQGMTSKDPAMSMVNEKSEILMGGVLAVAEILSNFVGQVNLYTASNSNFLNILKNRKKNIKIINLDPNRKTQIKTRFINANRSEKMLQVTNFKNDNSDISDLNKKLRLLKKKIKKNLIICDYGIGFFSSNMIKFLESLKIKKYLNVQTNSLNLGFNSFTKYKKFNYLCLDKREWEIGLQNQKIEDKNLVKYSKNNSNVHFALTDGKYGSTLFYNSSKFYAPVFISKTVDTTGCGDAYFSITSLLLINGFKNSLIPFLGNVYAGLHSNFHGNKDIVKKNDYFKFLKSITEF
tara:strand:- start:17946 stop:19433 length:1488 start_codon:yes stop_codon:yes gene_type:complete